MGRRVVALLSVTAIYAAILGSVAAADLALGALLGAALLRFAGQPGDPPAGAAPAARRAASFPAWIGSVVAGAAAGTWRVARAVARPAAAPPAGIVAVPLEGRTPDGAVIAAFAATASPGDVVVQIDWGRQVMYVHVIDASDPEAVRRRLGDSYRRRQRRVFP